MEGEQAQPEGSYPRLNSSLLQSGKYNGMIVSLVGQFVTSNAPDGSVNFRTSDGGTITFTTEHAEIPQIGPDQPPYEAIGQVQEDGGVTLFVTRELTKDMDLQIYDKMLAVQHNPKFAQYFAPVRAG